MEESSNRSHQEPWNKGKLIGQNAPFKLKDRAFSLMTAAVQTAMFAGADGCRQPQKIVPFFVNRFERDVHILWLMQFQCGAAEYSSRAAFWKPNFNV
jgi:hypothetical protein